MPCPGGTALGSLGAAKLSRQVQTISLRPFFCACLWVLLQADDQGRNPFSQRAVADFSVSYAGQNEKDHAALGRAVGSGKVKVVFEDEQLR